MTCLKNRSKMPPHCICSVGALFIMGLFFSSAGPVKHQRNTKLNHNVLVIALASRWCEARHADFGKDAAMEKLAGIIPARG